MAASLAGVAGLVARHPPPQTQTAEDGYRLWLRYAPPGEAATEEYRRTIRQIVVQGTSSTAQAIRNELTTAFSNILGEPITSAQEKFGRGALIVGTSANSPAIQGLRWQSDLDKLGPEGYVIRNAVVAGNPVLAVASQGEIGALYGAFHVLGSCRSAPHSSVCRSRSDHGCSSGC